MICAVKANASLERFAEERLSLVEAAERVQESGHAVDHVQRGVVFVAEDPTLTRQGLAVVGFGLRVLLLRAQDASAVLEAAAA